MNIPSRNPSFNLLLQSVRLDDPDAAKDEAARIIRSGMIDWVDLLARAEMHCVRPQLENLLDKVSSPLVPDNVKEKLNDANRENLLRQLRSITEFFRIKKALDDEQIMAIPFKGFWLANETYGNIAERESYDIDLFIDIKDLAKVKSLMLERGYIITSIITKLTEDYISNELCEYNFDMYEGEICIQHFEFHWRSSMSCFRMNICLDDLRSQVVKSKIQDNELQVFSPSAGLLLIIMHHGGKEQFVQLKQVLDIAKIIKKHNDIDWQWLISQTKRFGIEKVLFTGICLSSLITGIKAPLEIEKVVFARAINRLAKGRIRMISEPLSTRRRFNFEMKGWLFHIRSRTGFSLKLHFLWHFFRKVLMPKLIPKRFHYLFYNKAIRIKTVVSNGD